MGSAFAISEDDIITVASRRGVEMSDAQASKWYDRLNHDAIEMFALGAVDMEDQTSMAMDAIESQLEEMGCFDAEKAEAQAAGLAATTPAVLATRPKRSI